MSIDGMTSTSTIDYLHQDPEIRGQKFVCLSFISPEDVLISRDSFTFTKFVDSFSKEMRDMFSNLNEYFKDSSSVLESLKLIEDKYNYIRDDSLMQQEYEFFKEKNSNDLDLEFSKRNDYRTSVRGIKVRGSYESIDEAKLRVESIRKFDKSFDVYVAEVGCWCPWSPNPNEFQNQEYCETALNSLVKSYQENEELKSNIYQDRKDDMMERIKKDMEQRKDLWLSAKNKEVEEKEKQEEESSSSINDNAQDSAPVDV